MFPLRGPASFVREFNPPKHNGVDIFADKGPIIVAPDDGEVRYGHDPLGGIVFHLKTPAGLTYYGAHLSSTQGTDRSVKAGDVVGYVGQSGNAAHTQPHLHLEMHDPAGAALDPYPSLDAAAGPDVKRAAPAPAAAQPSAAPSSGSSSSTAQPGVTFTVPPILMLLGLVWLARKERWI